MPQARTEAEFCASIDANLPYSDSKRFRRLLEEALRISPNAVCMMIYECVQPPRSKATPRSERESLLAEIERRFDSPWKASIFEAAHAVLAGRSLDGVSCLRILRQIGDEPGQYNGLAIALAACPESHLAEAEGLATAIQRGWMAE
ncbi:MAG: hypothetical protein NXI31_20800 [bacterium]|nr:hypothetical protein [bacterium]